MNITQEQIFKEMLVTSRSLATNPAFDTPDKIATAAEHIIYRSFNYATKCNTGTTASQQRESHKLSISDAKKAIQLAYDSKGEELLALPTIASVFKTEFKVNWDKAQELAKTAVDKGLIVKRTQFKYAKNF